MADRSLGNGSSLQTATVFVVDDDPGVLKSVSELARSVDLNVKTFRSAHGFLQAFSNDCIGCLVLDVRLPGITGIELQRQLRDRGWGIPTILLTGYAEVSMATQALRNGAIDFIEKPHSPQLLLERIHEAIQVDIVNRDQLRMRSQVAERTATLSNREREVMNLLAIGQTTKEIARSLKISIKTVDNHRASVLQKMTLDNTAQLARLLARVDIDPKC